MPDQRSLMDQLRTLIPIANERGLYDAADYLRGVVERQEAREREDDSRIDTSEIPELGAEFFTNATLTRPGEDLIERRDEPEDDGDYLDRRHTGKVRA